MLILTLKAAEPGKHGVSGGVSIVANGWISAVKAIYLCSDKHCSPRSDARESALSDELNNNAEVKYGSRVVFNFKGGRSSVRVHSVDGEERSTPPQSRV